MYSNSVPDWGRRGLADVDRHGHRGEADSDSYNDAADKQDLKQERIN